MPPDTRYPDIVEWPAILLTARLALVTTLILFIVGTPLAWWLARSRSRAAIAIEAITAMPLVLPPTVLGFYLLILLSPTSTLGGIWVQLTGSALTFSFSGLVVASVIYSLPFMVQPLQNAFDELGNNSLEAAATLGAGPIDRFFNVALPQCRRGFITAGVMTFAHTVGEFGVVLMIGGNIPDETRVVSVQIYDHVEALDYSQAHWLAGGMIVFSFLILLLLYLSSDKAAVGSLQLRS